jgi:poly-gamma-glutamate capsule biosynthesis protein CapA/YwtB (metallophosphatase superfamily)
LEDCTILYFIPIQSKQKLKLNTNSHNIWGTIHKITQHSDLFIFNLETTITNSMEEWPQKTFHFRLKTMYSKHLKISNVNHVSLANNHILDFSTKGMLETCRVLDSLSIGHCGCGKSLKESQRPAEYQIKGINIKCFSAANHEEIWRAGTEIPGLKGKEGIWYIDIENEDYQDVLEIVKNSKKNNDFIIFSIHWGPNYSLFPSLKIQNFAHLLIDNGVNVIHGHSAHHVQRMENYKNGVIFYSMGDFIDDYSVDETYRNDLGCLVELEINQSLKIEEIKIYPTKISNFQVNFVTEKSEYDFVVSIIENKI